MAKADAEDGDIGIQQFLNHRHGIFARRGGVARTIGKEYASRLLRHDIFKAGGSRKDCHLCSRTNTIAEDVTLGAIVNGDDMGAFREVERRVGTEWVSTSNSRWSSGC